MISASTHKHMSERSLLLTTSLVLVWSALVAQSLVSASPLTKSSLTSVSLSSSPIESKAAGETASPSDYYGGEEDMPTPLETLVKLLSSQPQLRLLRPDGSSDGAPTTAVLISRKDDGGDSNSENNARLAKLLQSYLQANNNRLPRRFGPTLKRAAAMGVDLPDYILHINKGRNFDFSSFREKMQKSG